MRIDYYLETILFFCLFLFGAPRDKTRGGGGELIFNIALIRVVNPIKSILACIKGVILDASLKLAKASAKRASLNTRHRRACLSLHAPLAHAFARLTKGEKKNACYVG